MYFLRFIIRNLDRFRPRVALLFLVSTVDGTVSFFVPVLLAEFTRNEFRVPDFQRLMVLVGGLYVISLVLQWFIRNYAESFANHFGNYLRLKYFRALEYLPMNRLTQHHSGFILSLLNKVGDGMFFAFLDIFWTIAHALASITLFFIFTARESLFIALVNLVILLVFVGVSALLSARMVPIAAELNVRRATLLGSYADFMANILTIKKLGVYDFAEKKLDALTDKNRIQIEKLQRFHANRWFLLHAVFGAAYLSTIGFLLFQISRGMLSVSVLILFLTAYFVLRRHVERLSEIFKSFLEMKAYVQKLEDVVDLEQKTTRKPTPASWREIHFEDVYFQHEGTKKHVEIPRFVLKRGERICIVGRSGEGKSTFLNLLARFYTPQQGRRLIDGKTYEQVGASFFQGKISMVSQEVELFNLSLRDNLTLGRELAEGTLRSFLEEVDLWQWVTGLPQGLDTIVGEKGVRLSAGQKQRMNLVRTLLLDKDIYLLDEPTSHLDTATEKKVIAFLDRHLADKTAVIVAHREGIRSICQRSYLMKNNILGEE